MNTEAQHRSLAILFKTTQSRSNGARAGRVLKLSKTKSKDQWFEIKSDALKLTTLVVQWITTKLKILSSIPYSMLSLVPAAFMAYLLSAYCLQLALQLCLQKTPAKV